MVWKQAFVLGVALAAWLGVPSEAAAWTRAIVQSADATVEVEQDASVAVLLSLEVEVKAGWLHELELAGLGPEVTLDRRRPPYFRSSEGEVYRPEAELTEDGRIRLSFERREAPRKGEYRVLVRYQTSAAARSVGRTGQTELSWSLPAWETGLHDVSVDIRAPRGSFVPVELRDNSPGIELTTHERPQVSQLVWRRIHLPRHTPWKLSFHVPKGGVTLPANGAPAKAPDAFDPLAPTKQRPMPWAMLLFALLVLAKRRAIEVTEGTRALVVRMPWPLAILAVATLVTTVAFLAPNEMLFALPVLGLIVHRTRARGTVPPQEGWTAAIPSKQPCKESPLGDLLDATRVPGITVATMTSIALVALGAPILAIATLPLYLTATRQHRCPSARESGLLLADFVASLRMDANAPPMSFRWQSRSTGAPRCRVVLPKERPGLLSLSLVTTTRDIGSIAQRHVMLLVETRAQSDADDLARRASGAEPDFRTDDGRIGRLVEWGPGAMTLIRSLECRTRLRPLRKSSGSWLLRKMNERHSKAA